MTGPILREGTRNRKVLQALTAAAPGSMTARQLAEAHGEQPTQRVLTVYGGVLRKLRDQGWITTSGRAPREPWQKGPAITYRVTSAGRKALEDFGRVPEPKPAPGTHPWDAEAARRHEAGESMAALADAYGVFSTTVKRALLRQGVQVRYGLGHRASRRPRGSPRPEWAAEAAGRYLAGEARMRLASAYGVSDPKMRRVLEAEGVEVRGLREAHRMRRGRNGHS